MKELSNCDIYAVARCCLSTLQKSLRWLLSSVHKHCLSVICNSLCVWINDEYRPEWDLLFVGESVIIWVWTSSSCHSSPSAFPVGFLWYCVTKQFSSDFLSFPLWGLMWLCRSANFPGWEWFPNYRSCFCLIVHISRIIGKIFFVLIRTRGIE